jgi:hypothetical protein
MTSPVLLDHDSLHRALTLLGERLFGRGVVADIYVVGGAAMMLAYDIRRATRDIDALFRPHGVVVEEARAVARQLGLPDSWINEQASVYISTKPDQQARLVFEHPGLRVTAASPEHLLVMKILSARRFADFDDAVALLRLLDTKNIQEIESLCEDVFPQEPLSDRSRLFAEDALQAAFSVSEDQGYQEST